MAHGESWVSPSIVKSPALPKKRAIALKMPYCGSKKYFQNVPTTAGASIIGSRIAVLQKLCERNLRFSSSASPKPSSSCSVIDETRKCAVARKFSQIASSFSTR